MNKEAVGKAVSLNNRILVSKVLRR